jgi:multidrug resistance efflux pump
MLIVLAFYAALIWSTFFKLRLFPRNSASKVLVSLIGLTMAIVVVGLLNTLTPSGGVTVVAKVNQIAPLIGGVIETVNVTPNKTVETGQALLELDKRPYEYSLIQAEAKVQIAQVTFKRQEEVFKRGSAAVSKQSLDEASAALQQTKARYQRGASTT